MIQWYRWGAWNTNQEKVFPVGSPSEFVGHKVVIWAGHRKMDSPMYISNRNAKTNKW
jgi:hypothetical protein